MRDEPSITAFRSQSTVAFVSTPVHKLESEFFLSQLISEKRAAGFNAGPRFSKSSRVCSSVHGLQDAAHAKAREAAAASRPEQTASA